MKLVMTLLVRDEEDILEWNLRYHLSRGVLHVIVTDNLSVDGTGDILRQYEKEGVLTYLRESSDDYSQDRWVSRMAELAQSKFQPDWLIHSDADEFWWPDDFADLRAAFSNVPNDVRAVSVPRHNYLGPAHDGGMPFFDRMVYRAQFSVNALGKPLPPKVAHRPLEHPHVHQGNHGVSEAGQPVTLAVAHGLSILHFPARTPRQLENKIAKGGAAYARNTRFAPEVGGAWRAMHGELIQGRFERVLATHFVDPEEAATLAGASEDNRLKRLLSQL